MWQHLDAEDAQRRTEQTTDRSENRRLHQKLPTNRPRWCASAFRNPISRVRSLTETNMMFMTPIPPTNNDSAAMPVSSTVRVLLTEVAVVSSAS